MADTDFLDEAPEIDTESAIPPTNLNDPGKNWVDWSAAAIEGLPEGPNLDYIPVAGPLITMAKAAALATKPKNGKEYFERFKQALSDEQRKKAEYEKKYPESATVKNVIGNAPLLLLPELAGISKGATALSGLGRVGLAATENAAITAGDAALRGDSGLDIANKATQAAVLGGAFRGIPEAAGVLGKGAALTVSGIKPSTMNSYRANRKAVNELEPENLLDDASASMGKVRDEIISKKEGLDSKVKSEQDQITSEASNLRESAISKSDLMKEKGIERANVLTRDVAERMFDDMRSAQRDISAGSSQAFDVLEASGVRIPISYYKGYVTKLLNERKVGKTIPSSPDNIYLQKHRNFLDEIGEKDVSAREMKMIVQNLDDELQSAYEAQKSGLYVDKPTRQIQDLRQTYSDRLKQDIPGYREAMKPLAEKTRVLSDLQRLNFGSSPDKIYTALRGIDELGKKDKAEAIAAFEKTFKTNYQDAMAEAKALRETDYRSMVKDDLAAADVLNKSRSAVRGKYKDQYAKLKNDLDELRGLRDSSIQNQLLRYGNNPEKNVDLGRRLEALGKASGKGKDYYTDLANAYAIKRQFETAYAQGSRGVNLGAFSLAGLAKMAGVSMQDVPIFSALGAMMGGVADRLGPQTTKKIVDLVDSPLGKGFGKVYQKATQRGPQAIVSTHYMLMKNDPAYRNFFESADKESTLDNPDLFQASPDEDWLNAAPDAQ